jgi:LacI family transcriptional regulator
MAAEHFAERRFRHLGFVCYPAMTEDSDAALLLNAFTRHAGELGCECHQLVFSRWRTESEASKPWNEKHRLRQEEFGRWLREVPKPIGLFTFADHMAGRMVVTSLEQGLEVPGQVAVLGYGGVRPTCVSAPVPLSSVDPGAEEQCHAAVRLMQDLLDEKPAPKEAVRVPPAGVVVRESTDVLACDDPDVARAIRFMWDNLQVHMSVSDVAKAVSLSRRSLERAFREQIGYGVNAEWQRRRLERCCQLLRETDLTVADIAPQVGFRSKDYLHTLFRRKYGVTPRKYRVRYRAATGE